MKWQTEFQGKFYDPGERSVVYYDPLSGDTHLLSDFAAHVLGQFDGTPLGIDDLVYRLAPSLDSEQITDLPDTLTSVLEELVALDILKQAQ